MFCAACLLLFFFFTFGVENQPILTTDLRQMDWDVVNDAGMFLWANNRSDETGCIPDNGVARG
jgi:hypothetical protein